MERPFPFADLALARRIEFAEADSNRSLIDARAKLDPASGAAWLRAAGATALFDGAASPVTQTFGLGMARLPTDDELDELERFFEERGAPVQHEVAPLADAALWPRLAERGYRPIEFTSLLVRPIWPEVRLAAAPGRIETKVATGEAELAQWGGTLVKGWEGTADVGAFMDALCKAIAIRPDCRCYLALEEGKPIAAGMMALHEGVAILAGASTVPSARKRGAQLALLEARLRHAAASGCDLAVMGALPGSGSQRNAERHGFRIVYTRVKWSLQRP